MQWRQEGVHGPLAQLGIQPHLDALLDIQWHFLFGQPWTDSPPHEDRLYPCRFPLPAFAGGECRSATPSPSVSPSVFLPGLGPGAWQPDPSVSVPDNDTVVVIARNRRKDTLHWLNAQPYRYVVMEKGLPEGTPNSLPTWRGGDAASYMQFILEHWDHLPARMLFMHGHSDSWHNGVSVP